jgi:hypothetical protein
MPKPKNPIPSIQKNLSLPLDLVAKVDLELYSPLEGRVPHSAWARYVSQLIREDLRRREKL